MTRDEMHQRGAAAQKQFLTLFRKSSNGRLVLKALLEELDARLKREVPVSQVMLFENLLDRIPRKNHAGCRRFWKQHGPLAEGNTLTISLWSHPGAAARGEFDEDRADAYALSQEFIRFLVPALLHRSSRLQIQVKGLREVFGASHSTWSNISSSFAVEDVMGHSAVPTRFSKRGSALTPVSMIVTPEFKAGFESDYDFLAPFPRLRGETSLVSYYDDPSGPEQGQ